MQKSRRIPIELVRQSKVGDHYYCPTCGRAYDKLYSMRYHLASEACRRQTCNEEHEHEFINKQFENLNEALEYIKAQELDSQFHRRSCYSKNVYYAVSNFSIRNLKTINHFKWQVSVNSKICYIFDKF